MELPGIGTAIGAIVNKVTQWIPNPKQSKLNKIDKLTRENEQLQRQFPLSTTNANRMQSNADSIKLLRKEFERLD